MKHISIIPLIAFVMLFAACDKIDEGHYTYFSGAAGTWYESTADIPHTPHALIEKYTGVRCVNCPKADEVIHSASEKYGDQLIAVAIHSHSTGFGRPLNDDPTLCTPEGDELYNYFGIFGQPKALINRVHKDGGWDLFTPTSNFDSRIDDALGSAPKVAIMTENGKFNDSTYNTDIHLEFLESLSEEVTVSLLIIEDKIYTTQISPEGDIDNYEQNHVLRTFVTNLWGLDYTRDKSQGSKSMVRLTYQLPDNLKPENCHTVAFVSFKESREIINAIQQKLIQ